VSERQKTSVIIDPELWQRVRVAAVQRGVDRADAGEEGLRLWMEEEPPKTPSDYDKLSKRDRAIVDAAIDFLLNEPPENQKRRRVIEGVLQVFRG
jgi:hypothetical protein